MGIARNILNWYSRLSPKRGVSLPPYEHVVQIGDPILRKNSELVPINKIRTREIQDVIKKLEFVIDKYGSVGMSAPQIGINLRIFAMRLTHQQMLGVSRELVRLRGMEVIPLTVFINPHLKVLDYHKVSHNEGCESIQGYIAEVPRYISVEVTALDSVGDSFSRKFRDWTARVVQHEIDHLDGRLYTDIMDRKTLTCACWKEVNLSKGKVAIPLSPH